MLHFNTAAAFSNRPQLQDSTDDFIHSSGSNPFICLQLLAAIFLGRSKQNGISLLLAPPCKNQWEQQALSASVGYSYRSWQATSVLATESALMKALSQFPKSKWWNSILCFINVPIGHFNLQLDFVASKRFTNASSCICVNPFKAGFLF